MTWVDKNNKMKDNKLIAEFMGLVTPSIIGEMYVNDPDVQVLITDCKWHESWDWLMPVVEKINGIAHEGELYDVGEYEQLTDHLIGANIEHSYGHVVQFIKWHNTKGKP